ncbi:MAG: glycosyltransferase, partial [Bacteroidota bacterium]
DKNPTDFFKLLERLVSHKVDFQLVVLGESYRKQPPIFNIARQQFQKQLLHFGYAEGVTEYAHWLWKADIALTTSYQDFFGGSVVEAIYCKCLPILPNRLAYPEHLPQHRHTSCLYNNLEEAYQMLFRACMQRPDEAILRELSNTVANYDWSKRIKIYDEQLEEVLKN